LSAKVIIINEKRRMKKEKLLLCGRKRSKKE
jgi:hypothetical protein